MKTFEIGVFEEQGGYLTIHANSQKEAEEMALDFVNYYGMDSNEVKNYFRANGKSISHLNITHRDVQLV